MGIRKKLRGGDHTQKMLKFILSILLLGGGHGMSIKESSLPQHKSTIKGCTITPSEVTNPMTPAKENTVIEIHCNIVAEYAFCQFQHLSPVEEEEIDCIIIRGDILSKTCLDDSNITLTSAKTSCGLRMSNPDPEDTGKWTITVGEIKETQIEISSEIVEIFTYNQTKLVLQDEKSQEEIPSTYEVWYNYDEEGDRWRNGTSGFERVEMICKAQYGRPVPEIMWTIDQDDKNHLHNTNLFIVQEGFGTTYDQSGFIQDWISELSFDVNAMFLKYLADTHGIDTNPESGSFSFDLYCNAEQGVNGEYFSDDIGTRVTVQLIK